MVKTLHFQYRGCSFDTWLGNKDLTCCVVSQKLIFLKIKKKSFKAARTARKNGLTPRVSDLVHPECGRFQAGIFGVCGVFGALGHQAAVGRLTLAQPQSEYRLHSVPPRSLWSCPDMDATFWGTHPRSSLNTELSVACNMPQSQLRRGIPSLTAVRAQCNLYLVIGRESRYSHYLLFTLHTISSLWEEHQLCRVIIPSSETAEANKKLHDHSGCHTKRGAVPRRMFHWAAQASGQKGSY